MDTTSTGLSAWTYKTLLKQAPYILLWGGILGFAIFQNFFRLSSINLIYYIVLEYKDILPEEMMFSLLTGVILSSYIFYSAGRSWERSTKEIVPVFYPLVLLIPFSFIPTGVYTPLVFIATVAVVVFRYFRLISPETELHFRQLDFKRKRTGLIIVALFSAGFVAYGFYIQKRAFDGMYLCWSDWAYFYESMRNTLSGNWFWLNKLHMNFIARRFYPGLTILLPYIILFDNEYAFFLMNSMVLASGGVVVYLLGRRLKFSLLESTFFALGYLLIPGVFNMNLAVFYSFHEIYFVIPLVFLTFYFFEGKRYVPALLLFLFSMTFKETVPILWLGFGGVFVMQRRFKLAAFIIITSLTYFSLVNFMVMPWIRQGMTDYSMMRYTRLGDSSLQVALSPFIRPDAFWGALFRPGTFYLLATLLLPVFILTLSSPLMLLAMSIVFMFSCIEDTNQTQNIMLHYQSMMLAAITLNTMYAYRRLKEGQISPWFNILGFGIQSKVGVQVAVIASTAASLLLCVLFLTQNHISKNGISHFINAPDCRPAVTMLKGQIPSGAKITAPERVAAHFFLTHNVFHDLDWNNVKYPLQDYVVIDLFDSLTDVYPLRDFLAHSSEYSAVYALDQPSRHHFLIYRKNAPKSLDSPLAKINNAQWNANGVPLDVGDKNFSARVMLFQKNGRHFVRVMLRVVEKVDYDVKIIVVLSGSEEQTRWIKAFGDGHYPAYMAAVGDVFSMTLEVPDYVGTVQAVQCGIEPIAASIPDLSGSK